MASISTNKFLLFPVFAALLCCAGCSDDDPATPPVDTGPDPLPGTLAELVVDFMTAYEARDHERSLALLAPGFLMKLKPETMQEYPYCGTDLDRTEMDGILGRMFSGQELESRTGGLLPATTGIDFQVLFQETEWETAPPDHEFAGDSRALFTLDFLILRGQSYPVSRVQGAALMYAKADSSDIAGKTEIHYTLSGIEDLTGNKAGSETTTWGGLLALYYPPEE